MKYLLLLVVYFLLLNGLRGQFNSTKFPIHNSSPQTRLEESETPMCEDEESHFYLPKCYKKYETGRHHDGPVKVSLKFWINSVEAVDQASMQFTIHGYVIQNWEDPRFKGTLDDSVIMVTEKQIWMPDLYCPSCREKEDLSTMIIRIFNTSAVEYSQLTKLTVACYMDLRAFPFDEQLCSIVFGSYGYNDSYLEYAWDNSTDKKTNEPVEPVTIEEDKTAEFDIFILSETNKTYPYWSGNFTVLSAQLKFKRKMGFFVIQCFLPMIILVMLSWVSFYLDPSDVGNRLMIGVTLILTTVFLLGYNSSSLPKVSYIKAVDVYAIAALINIAITVFESVVVYWLLFRAWKKDLDKQEKKGGYEMPPIGPDMDAEVPAMGPEVQSEGPGQGLYIPYVKKVDLVSRIVFPGMFVIFNLVFLFKYQSDVQDQFNKVYAEATKAVSD